MGENLQARTGNVYEFDRDTWKIVAKSLCVWALIGIPAIVTAGYLIGKEEDLKSGKMHSRATEISSLTNSVPAVSTNALVYRT